MTADSGRGPQAPGGHPRDDFWLRAAVQRGALKIYSPPSEPVALLFWRHPPSVAAARYGDPWSVDLLPLEEAATFSIAGSA
jgi:hypothetical protein